MSEGANHCVLGGQSFPQTLEGRMLLHILVPSVTLECVQGVITTSSRQVTPLTLTAPREGRNLQAR